MIRAFLIMAALFLAGCTSTPSEDNMAADEQLDPPASVQGAFGLASTSFNEGERIPTKHTCDAEDVSPALAILNGPDEANYFTLIMDDPDAPSGTWTHWTFWDLPDENRTKLVEGVDVVALGAVEGTTSFGSTGYGGPCPPPPTEHRYFFYLFATAEPLGLPAGAPVEDLWAAAEEAKIAEAQLMGTYSRPNL